MTHMDMMEEVLRARWKEAVLTGEANRNAHFTYPDLSEALAEHHGVAVSPRKLVHMVTQSKRARKRDGWHYHDNRMHVVYVPVKGEDAKVVGLRSEANYDALAEELAALFKRHGFTHATAEVSPWDNRLDISVPLVNAHDFKGAIARGLG